MSLCVDIASGHMNVHVVLLIQNEPTTTIVHLKGWMVWKMVKNKFMLVSSSLPTHLMVVNSTFLEKNYLFSIHINVTMLLLLQ
jgi:hypothetical protein